MIQKIRFLCVCACIFGLTAAAQPVRVAAASSLRPALDQILARFHKLNPQYQIRVVYGASGSLCQMMLHGADFALLMAADTLHTNALMRSGIATGTPEIFALGRLCIWSPGIGVPAGLQTLTDSRIQRIAIANPLLAPYGQRWMEVLKAQGWYPKITAQWILAENVAQATQYVQSGNADAGLLAYPLLVAMGVADKAWLLPAHLHGAIPYSMVATQHGASWPAVNAFIRFLKQPEAGLIWKNNGYELP